MKEMFVSVWSEGGKLRLKIFLNDTVMSSTKLNKNFLCGLE